MAKKIQYEGKFLRLLNEEGWEYVERVKASGVVAVLAVTDHNHLLLVEQYRKPVAKHVIELPAGLSGDITGQEEEDLSVAAKRELLEETGYEAAQYEVLNIGPTSSGLTSETVVFFKASNLKKMHEGGGDESETITVHEVPLPEIDSWLITKRKEGALIDFKIYAGLYFLK